MENCTGGSNCTSQDLDRSVFEVLGFLMPTMGGLSLLLNIPTIVILCTTPAVAKGLRMYLISTLVSGILISTSSIPLGLIVLVTVFSGAPAPPTLLCRFIIWVIHISVLARSFSVAGFSIMVLVVVRYGKNVKVVYIILSLCFVWGISLLLSIQYQVPQVYGVSFFAGAVCFPVKDDTIFLEARLFFTVFVLMITIFVPLAVCIAVPIVVFCYTKKHSITGDINYWKAAAKLGLFLLTGSLIYSTVSVTSTILVYFTTGSTADTLIIYFVFITNLLSLYFAPFLIIIFLKPVRDKLNTFLKCACLNVCHPSVAGSTTKSEKAIPLLNTNSSV